MKEPDDDAKKFYKTRLRAREVSRLGYRVRRWLSLAVRILRTPRALPERGVLFHVRRCSSSMATFLKPSGTTTLQRTVQLRRYVDVGRRRVRRREFETLCLHALEVK